MLFHGRSIRWLALWIITAGSMPALDPRQAGSSYIRDAFEVENGLPSNVVNSILQTRNGFLWIGTDAGLARFNGRHFTLINFRGPRSTSQEVVRKLEEGPNGDLWVGTNAGLVRIKSAALEQFDTGLSTFYHPGTDLRDEITCLKFTHDGILWVGTSQGLFRFERDTFAPVLPRLGVTQLEEAANGHLLIVAGQEFLEWDGQRIVPHTELAELLQIHPDWFFHVIQDRAGATWFATGVGIARQVGKSIQKYAGYGVSDESASLRVYEDQLGNMWILKPASLVRITHGGLETLASDIHPRSIYADRDGNLWVGTNGDGLLRFKDRPVRMFTTRDGLPSNIPMAVLATRTGKLWVGSNCGGISLWDGRRFKTFREKHGLSNSCVWALAEDHNNDIWVGTWGGGLYRFRNGTFTQYSTPEGLADSIVNRIIVADDGSLWIATANGLSHRQNGHFRNYTTADGLSSNRVVTVYQDHNGRIWAGTSRGIDRMQGDRFKPLASPQEMFDPQFIALAESPSRRLYVFSAPKGISRIDGDQNQLVEVNTKLDVMNMVRFQKDLWFSGRNAIFRIAADSLERPSDDTTTPLDYTSFGRPDGLYSAQCSIGSPNMALTADGNLWVATVQGLASLDLKRLPLDSRKPRVFIEEVSIGRKRQLAGDTLVLDPDTRHLELKFDSIEFASPEKIRFQYRLDGVDTDWLDADTTRTAVYTSIPAGTHGFHVRACNSDGVWDRQGIGYDITRQPHLYETTFFRFAVLGIAVALLAALYQLRLRQVAARLNAGLDERLSERMRLARELHDTLLQTIQGSKLVADNALRQPNDLPRMHMAMLRLTEWLSQALQESRAVLNSLHTSSTQNNDLAEALRRVAQDHLADCFLEKTLSVEGTPRQMQPIVWDEIYRIGSEAIRNACTHSAGTRLEMELVYSRDLTLHVRDDGNGIDKDIVENGKEGHFGLSGMVERAERIGAKLSIFSSAANGTEIELVVPGSTVFTEARVSGQALRAKLRELFKPLH
jgi:ligand-binding sensor domain-containing protein/signal transduction histidine kinase